MILITSDGTGYGLEASCGSNENRYAFWLPGTGQLGTYWNFEGCLTCRKRKVKCDEAKPRCSRCIRLERVCVWSDELQAYPRRHSESSSSSVEMITQKNVFLTGHSSRISRPSGQHLNFEYPDLDRNTMPYIHHFITFCCRFIAYPNDNEGNPFEQKLVPLASSSPALLHAST